MSVIDSRRYGRRSTASFTREEFEQIKNTPPPDLTALEEESKRFIQRVLEARRLEEEEAASATD